MNYRHSDKDFTRDKTLSFPVTLLIISNFIRKSLSLEIVDFVNVFNKISITKLKNFTKSAFVQRRNKIKPEVFKYLSSVLIKEFYTDNDLSIKLWNGFRLLAVDGSRINLPDTKELEEIYGRTKNQAGGIVQARTSILYDLLNKFVLDSELAPLSVGENVLALEHLNHTQKDDLVIYDRGYPSFELVYHHTKREIDFLIRVKTTFNNVVKEFVKSKKKSQIVFIKPGKNISFKEKEYKKDDSIKVRLIAVKLNDGNVEILMTSLLDSKKYSNKIFKELYFKRWGIETFYDEFKNKLKVEYFSGYSNNTIRQDFNVAIFVSNIQSLVVNDLEQEIQEKTKNRKLEYKVNANLSYGFLKNRIISLLIEDKDMVVELKELFSKHLVPIRPNRKNKREYGKYRSKTKPKTYTNRKDAL